MLATIIITSDNNDNFRMTRMRVKHLYSTLLLLVLLQRLFASSDIVLSSSGYDGLFMLISTLFVLGIK